ncbi:MAG: DUF3784 domain-containing protein [Firmicutes bacterium]|jgi:hypothetical protein|nr:DUF3784 domain-containing protein [Bacillota bacterium]
MILVFVGALLIFSGLAVHVFKFHSLIAGFNTLPKERQAHVDIEGLSRLVGIYLYISGGSLILGGILEKLGSNHTLWFVLPVALGSISLVFLAQKYDGSRHLAKKSRGRYFNNAGVISIISTLVTLLFVGVLLFYSYQPVKANILDEGIKIEGMYGGLYQWSSIETVELKDSLPNITRRTNGASVGAKLKGHFSTTEYGGVKLLLDKNVKEFIYLQTDRGLVIFNLTDAEATKQIYKQINERGN